VRKIDLSVDQAVIVWEGVSTRVKRDGRVAKIARRYVTIEVWMSSGRTREIEFDIVSQKERGNTSHYAAFFRTPEAQAREDQERDVRDALRFYGLMPKYTGPTTKRTLTLDQMAAVVELLDRLVGRGDEAEADSGTSPGS
jgi:hypothetical protein